MHGLPRGSLDLVVRVDDHGLQNQWTPSSVRIEYTPLLRVERDLLDIPRGPARFREYLRTILKDDGADVELAPLVAANPMAKDHVARRLDEWLELDVDGVAARALAGAAPALAEYPGAYKAALVLTDEQGGWTNRAAVEFENRFGAERIRGRPERRFWIAGILWSGEPPAVEHVRATILTAAYRKAHIARHGPAHTLRDMMIQEGWAMAAAGCPLSRLDPRDLDHTRSVLAPLLEQTDMRTAIECLFGDEAGRTLGFTPRGLKPNAGLAVALDDALHGRIEHSMPAHSS